MLSSILFRLHYKFVIDYSAVIKKIYIIIKAVLQYKVIQLSSVYLYSFMFICLEKYDSDSLELSL